MASTSSSSPSSSRSGSESPGAEEVGRGGQPMRIEVIPALCRGHRRCSRVAPELFGHDENGFPWVLVDEVPEELAERARQAVYACPSKALLITTG